MNVKNHNVTNVGKRKNLEFPTGFERITNNIWPYLKVDRAPAWCSRGHMFEPCKGLMMIIYVSHSFNPLKNSPSFFLSLSPCSTLCLVPWPHYSARPIRFGSPDPSEEVRPRQKVRPLMRCGVNHCFSIYTQCDLNRIRKKIIKKNDDFYWRVNSCVNM